MTSEFMYLPLSDIPMSVCGDQPSFTKTELNTKDNTKEIKGNVSSQRISPQPTLASKSEWCAEAEAEAEALRRRARPDDEAGPANKALLHAALGSFRWPPFLLLVWMVLLLLTHALHCLLTLLSGSLPHVKRVCQYFRAWTESAWRQERAANARLLPPALAAATGMLYCVYFAMYSAYAVVLWSIEPLNADGPHEEDEKAKVIHYLGDLRTSRTLVKT